LGEDVTQIMGQTSPRGWLDSRCYYGATRAKSRLQYELVDFARSAIRAVAVIAASAGKEGFRHFMLWRGNEKSKKGGLWGGGLRRMKKAQDLKKKTINALVEGGEPRPVQGESTSRKSGRRIARGPGSVRSRVGVETMQKTLSDAAARSLTVRKKGKSGVCPSAGTRSMWRIQQTKNKRKKISSKLGERCAGSRSNPSPKKGVGWKDYGSARVKMAPRISSSGFIRTS